MGAVQHVFRRGATYWWRRRLIKKSGESDLGPVAISLQTREPVVARTIAAHLTLESDRILREGHRRMLSAQQVKSLLTTAVSHHLRKLDRVAALELADGISAADGRRSDLIMGWALRLTAARGPNATVDFGDQAAILESGLSAEDLPEISETIALLRKQGQSEAPRAKILQMLNDCGGSQTPGDVVEAQSILHRAQAAALMAVDRRWSGRFIEDSDLVDRILSHANTDVAATIPQAAAVKNTVATDPAEARWLADVPPAPAVSPVAIHVPAVSFLALADRLIEEKAKLNEWRPKTQAQVRSVAELFVKMIGADDVALVSQGRVADYRTLLLKLPKNYGKDPKDFDRPLSEILETAKALKPDEVGREGSTLNRHLTQLKTLIEYIETSGQSVGDYKGVQKLRAKVLTRARDARAVFSCEDVRGIFAKEVWTGSESEKNRLQPGTTVIHDSLYWVPLLGKATLGRREELCGLDVDDIAIFEDIPFIHLRFSEHRPLKNQQSIRRIPLIGEITRLGFLQYRDTIKLLGHRLLFPELKANSDRTPYGDVFHGDWIKIQDAVIPNAEDEKKSFHSFRKTSANDLKEAGVTSELRADILGHGGQNITEERYASSAKLQQMLDALKKLPDYTSHLRAREITLREDVKADRPRASAKPRRRPTTN
ncbi:MAG: phage integrase family protein [Tardiphaga sp.]|nr:phage integrase family protein [Tardiphaga sp.]